MDNKQIAETIVTIAKDLNVFVRAAGLRNLVVDSNLGPLMGNLVVSVSDYVPAIATSAMEGEAFDEIQKRASFLVNESFNAVDHSKLETLDDETAKESIKEALANLEKTSGAESVEDVSLNAAASVAQDLASGEPV